MLLTVTFDGHLCTTTRDNHQPSKPNYSFRLARVRLRRPVPLSMVSYSLRPLRTTQLPLMTAH